MSKKGMLLVGHGSTMPYNQELVEKTAAMIQAKNSDFIVKCGFMNMNKPSIKESMEAFRKESIDALVVVPLFLAKTGRIGFLAVEFRQGPGKPSEAFLIPWAIVVAHFQENKGITIEDARAGIALAKCKNGYVLEKM